MRGRPPGLLARFMDLTALVLDNIAVRRTRESLVDEAYRKAWRMATDPGTEPAVRQRAKAVVKLLEGLMAHHRQETERQERLIDALRAINEALDGPEAA